MDISIVLTRKYSDCLWELHGFDYDGLVWLDDSEKPSKEALESQYSQVLYEIEYKKVEEARRDAYTKNSDPIFFSYQRGEATKEDWELAVQEIKLANPYPAIIE